MRACPLSWAITSLKIRGNYGQTLNLQYTIYKSCQPKKKTLYPIKRARVANIKTINVHLCLFFIGYSHSCNSTKLFFPGTSSLSQPIMFTTSGQETAAAAPVSDSSTASAVGVAMACILVAAVLLAAGLYYRYRKVSTSIPAITLNNMIYKLDI